MPAESWKGSVESMPDLDIGVAINPARELLAERRNRHAMRIAGMLWLADPLGLGDYRQSDEYDSYAKDIACISSVNDLTLYLASNGLHDRSGSFEAIVVYLGLE